MILLLGCYLAYCAAPVRGDPPSRSSGVLLVDNAAIGDAEPDALKDEHRSSINSLSFTAPPTPGDPVETDPRRSEGIRAATSEAVASDELLIAVGTRPSTPDVGDFVDDRPAAIGLSASFARTGGQKIIASPQRGVTSDARSVVIVLDASGSMMSMDFAVCEQAEKLIHSLRRSQAFNIIAFADGPSPQALSRTMLMSTPENQTRAAGFVRGIRFRGTTDPEAALKLAFQHRPALIYVLTDGGFGDKAEARRLFRQPKKSPIPVHILQFAASTQSAETDLLRRAAKESGGAYTLVNPNNP
ncbi:MAG: VWA domain-containing protein [Tepidisphaeraceae bacterium]